MISFIIPTVGRPSLLKTLASIECLPGDEILVVGDGIRVGDRRVKNIQCPKGNDWGHTERNHATQFASCCYLAHIDDDDAYAPGTRALMADAITKTPGRPVLFRMQYPSGLTLWREPQVYCGNVGTPMILIPNMPTRLGQFRPFVGGDCAYLEEMKWKPEEIVWRPEVIALLGHNT
jgi:hypothetical protein